MIMLYDSPFSPFARKLCMDELDICKADVRRVKDFMQGIDRSQYEFRRIAWRGDRLEWVMRRGFHAWFAQEIEQGRVMWPGEE